MDYIQRFKKRMEISGNSLRQEYINNSKNFLQTVFSDDASYTYDIYLWEVDKTEYIEDDMIPIRLYNRKKSNDEITIKFQSLSNINVGNILYDKKNNNFWLCTESFDIDEIHYQGKLTYCNWILKWQNDLGKIFNYPCYVLNVSQNNDGEKQSNSIVVGTTRKLITLPCDDNTLVLHTSKRFYLDKRIDNPISYIITQNDNISGNYGNVGLVKLVVSECEEDNSTDRPDLGLCDYIDNNKDILSIDNSNNITSTILFDTNIIKSGGNSQTFIGEFKDENNNDILTLVPKWDVICDFKNELEINDYGNKLTLSIDNDNYVDEDIKLIFSDENNNYSSTLLVTVESLL